MNDIDILDKRIESLVLRVTALEKANKDTSPASPAPLVERMCVAANTMDHARLKAALLVAAEELLGPVTEEEADEGILGANNIDDANAVLRARLARAKEAARG